MEDILIEIATDFTVAFIVWVLMRDTKSLLLSEIRYYRQLTFRIQGILLKSLGVENAVESFNPDDIPITESKGFGGD